MIKDIPALITYAVNELRKTTDIAVVGLSGGADSTLVAILCMLALTKKNVYGIHMPGCQNDVSTFNHDSQNFANFIGIPHTSIHIESELTSLLNRIELNVDDFKIRGSQIEGFTSELNLGNMKARTRMLILYSVNQMISESLKNMRCRVIGTGNLSEDYIGYATKHGDLGVDINPIGDLFKSEVYQLLNWFRTQDYVIDDLYGKWDIKWIRANDGYGIIREEHINEVPSAGLWKGQTDEEELGYTYNEMEIGIRIAMGERMDVSERNANLVHDVCEFVLRRHMENKHKMDVAPIIKLREYCE